MQACAERYTQKQGRAHRNQDQHRYLPHPHKCHHGNQEDYGCHLKDGNGNAEINYSKNTWWKTIHAKAVIRKPQGTFHVELYKGKVD